MTKDEKLEEYLIKNPDVVYLENGYTDREDYLNSLKEEYPENIVDALSDVLGESEDFDALITELEDYQELYGE